MKKQMPGGETQTNQQWNNNASVYFRSAELNNGFSTVLKLYKTMKESYKTNICISEFNNYNQKDTIMKFNTNIKCEGCIAKVTPFLNEAVGIGNWEVDLQNPLKTLTVKDKAEGDKIKSAIEKAGYKAEKIDQ